jgi:hypothetical protein
MWEHQNSVLHNTQLESSRRMLEADTNDVIMTLYEKVDTYSVEDHGILMSHWQSGYASH